MGYGKGWKGGSGKAWNGQDGHYRPALTKGPYGGKPWSGHLDNRSSDSAEVIRSPIPAAASTQAEEQIWAEGQPRKLRAFDRAHVLGAAGTLYLEIRGQCRLRLAMPAPTKLSGQDRADFNVPTEVAGRRFATVRELQQEILQIRSSSFTRGMTCRLSQKDEELMKAVFAYHPRAPRKLAGMQFLQVGPSAKSNDPNQASFFAMRNDMDGEEISYVSSLRCLAEAAAGNEPSEQVLALASVVSNKDGVSLAIGSETLPLAKSQAESFGLRVDLEQKLLYVHLASNICGPWLLRPALLDSNETNVPLTILADLHVTPVSIAWAAPFHLRQPAGAQPAASQAETSTASDVSMTVKKALESLMREVGVQGDLSTLSAEEVERIAGQSLVRSLTASLQVARSRRGAKVQATRLLDMARHQASELTHEQLLQTRAQLQRVEAEKQALEVSSSALSDELRTLRRAQVAVEPPLSAQLLPEAPLSQALQPLVHATPTVSGDHPSADAHVKLEELRKSLLAEIPEPAASMLRQSLKLMSSELYSGPARALWELLQNADDCRYLAEVPCMKIVEAPQHLWLEYNEAGFSFQDVQALCSLGSSTKSLGQTGQKGIGFKASFALSSKPHILSGQFRFFFDSNANCLLPEVLPQPITDEAVSQLPLPAPEAGTAIFLPLRRKFPELLDEVSSATMLFLRRVRTLILEKPTESRRFQLIGDAEGEVSVVSRRTPNVAAGAKQSEETEEEMTKYYIARRLVTLEGQHVQDEIAVAFPLDGNVPVTATVSTTLPVCSVPGLRTPLNGSFELTANREALLEGSLKNIALRDSLADLWLETVSEMSGQTAESLRRRAWLLQPGLELAQIPFWAPFVQRVRLGLQRVPMIPVIAAGSKSDVCLPINCCRNPASILLKDLRLSAEDLDLLGLGIPTDEYLKQLPVGVDLGLAEFGTSDLLELLCATTAQTESNWQARGNDWRKSVAKNLVKRADEIDLIMLRKVPLFPISPPSATSETSVQSNVTEQCTWVACGENHIYASAPRSAPQGLLRCLDRTVACKHDTELLKLMGCGGKATPRDVAHAIIQHTLGLAEAEDHRFSWSHLFYIGQHWAEITHSSAGAADAWLAARTQQEMETLLRSMLVPSCGGKLLHDVKELHCPFMLGCKPGAIQDRSSLIREPPDTNPRKRLWWELVFLRLGAKPCCGEFVELPAGMFRVAGIARELTLLLNQYDKLPGRLLVLRSKCRIKDRAGILRGAPADNSDVGKCLLGPAFIRFVGSEFVIDVGSAPDLVALAERLLCVVQQPSAPVVLRLLERSAKAGIKVLQAAYRFLAEAWRDGLLTPSTPGMEQCRKEGIWLPAGERGNVLKQVGDITAADAQQMMSPWRWPKDVRPFLIKLFVDGFGMSEGNVPTDPSPEQASTEPMSEPPSAADDDRQPTDVGGADDKNRPPPEASSPVLLNSQPASNTAAEFRRLVVPRKRFASGTDEVLPAVSRQKTEKSSDIWKTAESLPDGISLPPLPRLREAAKGNSSQATKKFGGNVKPAILVGANSVPGESASSNVEPTPLDGTTASSALLTHPPLPMLRELLLKIFHSNHGLEVLYGGKAPPRKDMSVADIQFTQHSVSATFGHGHLEKCHVSDVALAIQDGQIKPSDIPLRVVKFNEHYWSLNNRSLYALRLASEPTKPLVAQVLAFEALCPVTAKFVQLRCDSLMPEEDTGEDEMGPPSESEDEEMQEPELAADEEAILEGRAVAKVET
eukprot:TRINITY_DN120975_c0_g1_i1.p1 TRINITY_DN120975_c0_g1~~TRINITY_DN120975_c0_g1_i1.p1  ORF type:complete len:1739 (+),score=256.48 TRINITY_DN120975_c0_g1_i1:59-5275(+)